AGYRAVVTLAEGGSHLGVGRFWAAGLDLPGNPPAAVPADGPWARLLGATSPIVLSRRENREAFAALDSLAPRARTVLVAPMRVSDRVIGTFVCFAEAGRPFGKDDQELLSMVASQATVAVQNARLREGL